MKTDDPDEIFLINQAHPFGMTLEAAANFDANLPYAPPPRSQPLTAADWQTRPRLVNPPARMALFPTVLRLRPAREKYPAVFEVAGLLTWQRIHDDICEKRRD